MNRERKKYYGTIPGWAAAIIFIAIVAVVAALLVTFRYLKGPKETSFLQENQCVLVRQESVGLPHPLPTGVIGQDVIYTYQCPRFGDYKIISDHLPE